MKLLASNILLLFLGISIEAGPMALKILILQDVNLNDIGHNATAPVIAEKTGVSTTKLPATTTVIAETTGVSTTKLPATTSVKAETTGVSTTKFPGVSCEEAGGTVVGTQCLVFNWKYLTWADARDACSAQGQVLASVVDLQGLVEHIDRSDDGDAYWTGGSDAKDEGVWVWPDGRPIESIPWYQGYGNEGSSSNCLALDYEGYYDWACTDEYPYICAIGEDQSGGGTA